jgi:hypothetical protein
MYFNKIRKQYAWEEWGKKWIDPSMSASVPTFLEQKLLSWTLCPFSRFFNMRCYMAGSKLVKAVTQRRCNACQGRNA